MKPRAFLRSFSIRCRGLFAVLGLSIACVGTAAADEPSFRQDIIPILTKAGCNSGGCHGKLAGQNGFKLSLRGYAPEWDHDALVNDIGSRRIDFASPANSLLLQKAVGQVAHEGGKRFDVGSPAYQTLLAWIERRAPGPKSDDVDPQRLELSPAGQALKPGETRRLKLIAHYAGGSSRDVTWLGQFYSNDASTATVDAAGTVRAVRHGETTIRAHFQTLVAAVTITAPFEHAVEAKLFEKQNNVVDRHVFAKLKSLNLPPSADADDATFIRRASLDAIGMLPTPAEIRAFLADTRPDKRDRLIDGLLDRPEWADYWALQIGDLLQNRKERDHDVRGTKGVRAMHAWLRSELQANRPWDQLARSVLTASGDNVANPAVGYYIVTVGEKKNVEESEVADSVAQAFLGTRIGCARCHNHPLERYTQDDYYHFAAFFSRVALKRVNPADGATELATASKDEADRLKQIESTKKQLAESTAALEKATGDEQKKLSEKVAQHQKRIEQLQKELTDARMKMPMVRQPRTNQMMAPQPLDRSSPKFEPGSDPRTMLADWMIDPQNEAFAGAMVNRLWRHFMGVGLVEPVDDLRSSNPPTNPELWSALVGEFVGGKYDLKHVQRLILRSRAYQLDSATLPENQTDTRFYSHYTARRLPAEVLLDAVAAATDIPDQFPGYPVGVRAIQLPEPGVGSYFLTLFGRSDRVTACACERQGEVTLPQLLHLTNSQEVQEKIKNADGRMRQIVKRQKDDRKVTEELFLATVGRSPSEAQWKAVTEAIAEGETREAVFADLLWALLNSKEFAFNR